MAAPSTSAFAVPLASSSSSSSSSIASSIHIRNVHLRHRNITRSIQQQRMVHHITARSAVQTTSVRQRHRRRVRSVIKRHFGSLLRQFIFPSSTLPPSKTTSTSTASSKHASYRVEGVQVKSSDGRTRAHQTLSTHSPSPSGGNPFHPELLSTNSQNLKPREQTIHQTPPHSVQTDSTRPSPAEWADVPHPTTISTESASPKLDQINTLLAYPTLYDPIRKPRNPVVLCHGLYGFDSWGLEILPALRIHYWASVISVLKGVVGIEPIVTGVPGTGAIKDRAHHLHEALKKEKRLEGGKDLNLLAHSMGGLDCRYLISHIQPTEYNPRSLTTLATPHRGSPFMAWCRANIGIGDVAKAAAAAAVASTTSSSDSKSPSSPFEGVSTVASALPYSLKTPLLTRQQLQEKEEKRAREEAKKKRKAVLSTTLINFPGLNYSLGTSLASYLLDLLDSPAYSNLTPDFLNHTFNPTTPDRPNVRYFSIAAKTDKMNVTHPLWLPKLILDKTEEMEKNRLRSQGKWQDLQSIQWGNDGLVPIESAKWGEYLGCIEHTDHWQLRGGSGLNPEPKTKKQQQSTSAPSSPPDSASQAPQTVVNTKDAIADKAKAAGESVSSAIAFGWREVNTAVGDKIASRDSGKPTGNPLAVQAPQEVTANKEGNGKDTFSTLSSIANWIVKRIPLPQANSANAKALNARSSSINPAFPFDDSLLAVAGQGGNVLLASNHRFSDAGIKSLDPKSQTSPVSSSITTSPVSDTARLLFGSSSSSASTHAKVTAASSKKQNQKLNLEQFYVALCRKLYDEGL